MNQKRKKLHYKKSLLEAWEAIIKLLNDYSLISSEAKHKAIHGERLSSESIRLVRVAEASDCKV